MPIDPTSFAEQVYTALHAAFSELLAAHPKEHFYAFGIWTDDSLQFLHAVANTEEGLAARVAHYRKKVDPKHGATTTPASLRWSYGDWKYFPEVGAKHFNKINRALEKNFDELTSTDDDDEPNLEPLWKAIYRAFRRLQTERFFGTGRDRAKITLLLAGDLPDEMVEDWVLGLNPKKVAQQFIDWDVDAAEDDQ